MSFSDFIGFAAECFTFSLFFNHSSKVQYSSLFLNNVFANKEKTIYTINTLLTANDPASYDLSKSAPFTPSNYTD